MDRIGLAQALLGLRRHCLRWCTVPTFYNWEAAEMRYDSTISLLTALGFEVAPAKSIQRMTWSNVESSHFASGFGIHRYAGSYPRVHSTPVQ